MYTRGTKTGRLVYASGRPGGTVVTITLLFTFTMILLTVRLPTQLEQTKYVCAIIYLYVKHFIVLETVREANKLINNSQGEREVYNVDLFIFL
jgi:low temperature requirement protein LtrA